MRKTLVRIFGMVMAAVMISTSAYGTDISDATVKVDDIYDDGAFMYDCATGVETYIPDSGVSTHSNEIEGNSPAYDPYADIEEEFDDNLQPNMRSQRDQVTDSTSSFTSR